eukprot:UN03891
MACVTLRVQGLDKFGVKNGKINDDFVNFVLNSNLKIDQFRYRIAKLIDVDIGKVGIMYKGGKISGNNSIGDVFRK